MWTQTVTPRFGDADAMGHINNTVFSAWFELARNPLFRLFAPDLNLAHKECSLIMAHSDYDFIDQTYLQYDVQIRTAIRRIGAKSLTVHHTARQEGRVCVTGNTVLVCYDFMAEQSRELPASIKKELENHLEQI